MMINLDAVRTARRNLDRIAREHPELVGDTSADDWFALLSKEGESMSRTVQIAIRMVPELAELLDQFAADASAGLRKELPGMTIGRAEAARILITDALERRGYDVSAVIEGTNGN